jgi:large subunit ribosomal protein L22e
MISTSTQPAANNQRVTKKKEKSYRKYYVDLNQAVSNNLLSLEAAVKFLNQGIKVNGLKGKLGDSVKVSQTDKKDKQKNTIVVAVDNTMKFSKRYVKYLIKKFLKRESISSYLRVISNGSSGYLVKLFQRNVE